MNTQQDRPPVVTTAVAITAAGQPPKQILEHLGRSATSTTEVSVAYMQSPQGWTEPAQTGRFDEWTLVLDGTVEAHTHRGITTAGVGETLLVPAGTTVRYATPSGASYIAVCQPAFSPELLERHGGDDGPNAAQ
jgi:ethanolamine utilization protein EutQ (cupin superfamily)